MALEMLKDVIVNEIMSDFIFCLFSLFFFFLIFLNNELIYISQGSYKQ